MQAHSRSVAPAPGAADFTPGTCTPEQRLVMAMLTAPRAATPLWGEPTELACAVSWNHFLHVADDLVKPYLHWVTCEAPYARCVPSDVRERLAGVRRSTGMQNLRWAAELRAITRAFHDAGISLMLVKGSVLQRTVYPDLSTRPMRDIDLVVQREEMSRVCTVLAALGFLSRETLESQTPGPGLEVDEERVFYKVAGDRFLIVEIHTRLDRESPGFARQASSLWALRIEAKATDGLPVTTLEPHAALRHLCLHLAKHNFERGLMWLLDIRLLVERYHSSIEWRRFIDDCDPDTIPLIALTLNLARAWLGAAIPEDIRIPLPPAKASTAVRLVWGQLWDHGRSRAPPSSVTMMLRGDFRASWAHLRTRVRQWTTPIPNQQVSRLALAGKRVWSDLRVYRAAFREGGFTFSSILTACRSDRRARRIRALFWPPHHR